jgi:tRNA dimethylallyltransferase
VIRIICGPTAAGKSGIAMELAARHGLTIVSADSRQIYRGFDIGTAKPSAMERAAVRHLCVDVADPTERWSAARWADDASRGIGEVGEGRALVVGGTGLYLRALTGPFFVEPALDPAARTQLAKELEEWPLARLRDEVRRLDPARAHLGRTQLLRAIEVARLTGRRLSDLHREAEQAPRFRARWLVVDPGVELVRQIERRLDAMLAGGWIEEARRLAETVPESAPAWQACGYATVRDIALGREGLPEGRTAILVHTRQYAKRQRTWFRHQLAAVGAVTRVDPRASDADRQVRRWWEAEDDS